MFLNFFQIPVYLAKSLLDQLSIIQFPLRSSEEGYDKAEFFKVQVRPNSQEVQMELALDINSENYDHSTGENIALNMEKSGKNDQEEEKKMFSR